MAKMIEEKLATSEVESQVAVVPEQKPSPTISEVVALIRRESRQEPKRYLDEVHVPGGGE
jgi:hypothetical protein